MNRFIRLFLLIALGTPLYAVAQGRVHKQVGRGGEQEIVQEKLPTVCYGDIEKYWVKGANGTSIFQWSIYTQKGKRIDITPQILKIKGGGRGDTVSIHWRTEKDDMPAGIYTIEVIETTDQGAGCVGDPYRADIIVNRDELNLPIDEITYCSNKQCEIDFEKLDRYQGKGGKFFLPDLLGSNPVTDTYYTKDTLTLKVKFYSEKNGCEYSLVRPKKIPVPTVWLGNDTVIHPGEELIVDPVVKSATPVEYDWVTDSPNTAEWVKFVTNQTKSINVRGFDKSQNIRLTVKDQDGCYGRGTLRITVPPIERFRIPAAFTPNGDGINDTWVIPAPMNGSSMQKYATVKSVYVYDRWGTLVFKSIGGVYTPWDGSDRSGRPLPMDSYHYEVVLEAEGIESFYRGSITIVR